MPYESKMKFVVQRLNGDWLKFTDEGLPPESPKRWVFLPERRDVAVFSSRGGAEDRAGIAGVPHDEIEVFPHNQQGRQGELGYVSCRGDEPASTIVQQNHVRTLANALGLDGDKLGALTGWALQNEWTKLIEGVTRLMALAEPDLPPDALLLELTTSLSAALGEPKGAVRTDITADQLRNVWGHLLLCVKENRGRRKIDLAMAYELRSALGLAESTSANPIKTDADVRALWDGLIIAVRCALGGAGYETGVAKGRFDFQGEVARAAHGLDVLVADTDESRQALLLLVHTLRDRTDSFKRFEGVMEKALEDHTLLLFKTFGVAYAKEVPRSWEGLNLAVELAKEASELRLRREVSGAREAIIHGLLGALDPYKTTLRNERNEVELPRVIARVKSLADFRAHVVNILDQGTSAAREVARDNKKPMTERLLSAFKHDVFVAATKELLKPIDDEEPIEAA